MTHIMQNSITGVSSAHTDWTSYSLNGEEKLNPEIDHDYVPMNVYIDPLTMRKHFQGSSIQTG